MSQPSDSSSTVTTQPDLPRYVSIELSGEVTEQLRRAIETHLKDADFTGYEVKRGTNDYGHVTMVFPNDMPLESYIRIIDEYNPYREQEVEIIVKGIAKDPYCVCLLVETCELNSYPLTRLPHVTMMLHQRQPVYSNQLLKQIFTDKRQVLESMSGQGLMALGDDVYYYPFSERLRIKGTLNFIGHLKAKPAKQ